MTVHYSPQAYCMRSEEFILDANRKADLLVLDALKLHHPERMVDIAVPLAVEEVAEEEVESETTKPIDPAIEAYENEQAWSRAIVGADYVPPRRKISVDEIVRAVGKFYGITHADLISARRTSHIVRPRQVAMYLSRMLTLRSLPEIGRRIGNKDHTTVLHGVRLIAARIEKDQSLRGEILSLTNKLRPEVGT